MGSKSCERRASVTKPPPPSVTAAEWTFDSALLPCSWKLGFGAERDTGLRWGCAGGRERYALQLRSPILSANPSLNCFKVCRPPPVSLPPVRRPELFRLRLVHQMSTYFAILFNTKETQWTTLNDVNHITERTMAALMRSRPPVPPTLLRPLELRDCTISESLRSLRPTNPLRSGQVVAQGRRISLEMCHISSFIQLAKI